MITAATRQMSIVFGALVVALLTSAGAAGLTVSEKWPSSRDLWGSDITIRQFLNHVDPEALACIPSGALESKVLWGVETSVFRWADRAPEADEALRKIDEDAGMQYQLLPIYIHCTNSISHLGQRDVYYGASNTVLVPPFLQMPYMEVSARLGRVVGGAPSTPMGLSYANGWNVWRVTTNDSTNVWMGGEYQTESWHFAEAPAGYEPPLPVHSALVTCDICSLNAAPTQVTWKVADASRR